MSIWLVSRRRDRRVPYGLALGTSLALTAFGDFFFFDFLSASAWPRYPLANAVRFWATSSSGAVRAMRSLFRPASGKTSLV
jgi:hypothetical protein